MIASNASPRNPSVRKPQRGGRFCGGPAGLLGTRSSAGHCPDIVEDPVLSSVTP
jgi:hypothetical protein